ncbi:MAG: PAS domain-containing protein, partial [Flammeovirgaceae bacterium]|nr:PAS domain-containing protein [Flammeovirgaceae bacterium]MDW8287087.1 PAS domain-containing protein [Flammeovirgaceae bacterium]
LVKGVSFGGEICYQLSEEKSAWLYATFTPVKSTKGNFYKIIVLANDITSIKNELHDYRTYTKLLEENKLFAVFDLDTNFVDANDLFIQHFGYAREELLTLKHEAILPEKESIATQQEAFWQNIIQKGSSQKKCFERISSKGKSVWIDGQYVLTMNHKNKPNKIVLIGEVVFLGEIPAS